MAADDATARRRGICTPFIGLQAAPAGDLWPDKAADRMVARLADWHPEDARVYGLTGGLPR